MYSHEKRIIPFVDSWNHFININKFIPDIWFITICKYIKFSLIMSILNLNFINKTLLLGYFYFARSHFIMMWLYQQNDRYFADGIFKPFVLPEVVVIQLLASVPGVHLTICQHWITYWFRGWWTPSHYLNLSGSSSLMHICDTKPQRINDNRQDDS